MKKTALALALALASCSNSGNRDALGSVGFELDLSPGLTLDSASYQITGPASFSQSGTIDVRNSTRISAVIGGLPAGTGFNITISATLSDGVTTCSGSALFDVVAGATSQVSVHLLCHEPERTGSVSINGTINICPMIDALSAIPAEVTVGHALALSARAHDRDGVPSPISYRWTATSGAVMPADGASPAFTCSAPGTVTVTLTVSDGDCTDTATVTVTCSAGTEPPPSVVVNEVESSGGTPGDWVELYNPGASAVDLSSWVFRDNDDTHTYLIPAGSSIPAGGYFLLEEAALGFGLGSADSARLYLPGGVTLADSYSWTSHASTTYGRCPNGTGAFATTVSVTKGGANDCPGAGAATIAWPGGDSATIVDAVNQFSGNMSGLSYVPAGGSDPTALWAVQNGPSTLYKLAFDGSVWAPSAENGWSAGKVLHYPDGLGSPDSEGITFAEASSPAIYVSTERDNDHNSISRLSVLRFDTTAAGSSLVATHEWNLTADLPAVGPNLGLEAITWVPDTYLVGHGFVDESRSAPYDPAQYLNHGTGIFFVGVEANGSIYAYALDHQSGAFQRVATLTSGQASVMDLQFDRELGHLWTWCDNTCGNKASILALLDGRFQVARFITRPGGLPDVNNEGIAFAPLSECVSGVRSYFWTDDANTGGHSLRRGTITCGPLF
jgi:PKD repeat protein